MFPLTSDTLPKGRYLCNIKLGNFIVEIHWDTSRLGGISLLLFYCPTDQSVLVELLDIMETN